MTDDSLDDVQRSRILKSVRIYNMTDVELTIETQAADLYVNLDKNRNRIQINAGLADNVSMILTNEELFRLVRFVQEHMK